MQKAMETLYAYQEALTKAGAFIMIHPWLGGTGPAFASYYLNNLIHNPLETTVAAAHLIFGGPIRRVFRVVEVQTSCRQDSATTATSYVSMNLSQPADSIAAIASTLSSYRRSFRPVERPAADL